MLIFSLHWLTFFHQNLPILFLPTIPNPFPSHSVSYLPALTRRSFSSSPLPRFPNSGYQPDSSHPQSLFLPSSFPVDVKAVSAVACDLLIAASELCLIKRVWDDLEAQRFTLPTADDGSFRSVTIHDIWQVRETSNVMQRDFVQT